MRERSRRDPGSSTGGPSGRVHGDRLRDARWGARGVRARGRLFRSAGASRERCSGHLRPAGGGDPDRAPRSPAAPRCSTGSCPRNGTSATPTSRPRTAPGSSTSAVLAPRRLVQRAGTHADAARRAVRAPARRPTARSRPYRTSDNERTWGFCFSHRELLDLETGEDEVVIDSSLEPGHLVGERVIEGEDEREVWIRRMSAASRSRTRTSPGFGRHDARLGAREWPR